MVSLWTMSCFLPSFIHVRHPLMVFFPTDPLRFLTDTPSNSRLHGCTTTRSLYALKTYTSNFLSKYSLVTYYFLLNLNLMDGVSKWLTEYHCTLNKRIFFRCRLRGYRKHLYFRCKIRRRTQTRTIYDVTKEIVDFVLLNIW